LQSSTLIHSLLCYHGTKGTVKICKVNLIKDINGTAETLILLHVSINPKPCWRTCRFSAAAFLKADHRCLTKIRLTAYISKLPAPSRAYRDFSENGDTSSEFLFEDRNFNPSSSPLTKLKSHTSDHFHRATRPLQLQSNTVQRHPANMEEDVQPPQKISIARLSSDLAPRASGSSGAGSGEGSKSRKQTAKSRSYQACEPCRHKKTKVELRCDIVMVPSF